MSSRHLPGLVVLGAALVLAFCVLQRTPRPKHAVFGTREGREPHERKQDYKRELLDAVFSAPRPVTPNAAGRSPAPPNESPQLPGETFTVRVYDEQGAPLSEARCVAYQGAQEPGDFLADANGRVDIPSPVIRQCVVLHISKPTYSPRVLLRSALGGSGVDVALSKACEVSGFLALASAGILPSGVHVLAWPAGHAPSQDEIALGLAGVPQPNVFLAAVSPTGTFVMDELPSRGDLCITAGGQGTVGERICNIECGALVDIKLWQLYGLIVRLRSEGGLPLLARHDAFARGPFWGIDVDDAEPITGSRPEVYLSCTVPADVSPDARDDKLILFKSDKMAPQIGPVIVEVQAPGYEPVWSELWADPIISSIPEYELIARQTTAGFGTLDVFWQSPPSSSDVNEFVVGTLVMRSVEPSANSFSIPLLWPLREQRLGGMPFGRYTAAFQSAVSYYSCSADPSSVEIGKDSTSIWLGGAPCGILEVDIREGKETYNGSLQLRIVELVPDRVKYVNCARAPYVIPFMPPGQYHVEATIPRRNREPLSETVAIEDAKLTVCPLTLD